MPGEQTDVRLGKQMGGGKGPLSHNVILWEGMPSLLEEIFAQFIFHHAN